MKHDAKAASAGSAQASGPGLRGAVVNRRASSDSNECGAPSPRRACSLLIVLALAMAALAFSAAPASASNSEVGAITEVSYASAHVTGKVSASGFFNSATYEYSTDGSNWTTAFGETFFGAATNRVIAGTISVPKGETKYFVRLSLTSYGDNSSTSPSPYPSFTTLAVDPPAIPGAVGASPVFSTSATGTGKVKRPANTDPAFDVNCHFEYVTDAAYNATGFQNATSRACTQNPISGANAEPNVTGPLGCPNPVAEKPEGKCLAPETTYHLRLVAENASTTVVTKEAAGTFTTLPLVAKPVIGSTGVTEISKRTARGQGEVTRPAGEDPALDVSCHFEYVTEEQFTGNPSGEKFAGAGQAPCLGRNEVQVLTISATAGQFRLSANGMTTANIPYNVSAEDLRWALNDGGLFYYYDIRVEGGPGDGTGSSPYRITFPGGLLFPPETNIEQMTEQDGTTPLTGTATVTTQTNGASGFEFMNSPPTNQPKAMDTRLTGLRPNTTYHLRVVAENGGGTEIKEVAGTFKTVALIPPTLTVDAIENVGYTSLNITGTNDPGNQRAWAEVQVAPAGTEEWTGAYQGASGETEVPVQFTANFTGLKPGTTYQARLLGFNVEAYEYGEPFELTSAKPYPEFTTKGTSTPPSGGLTIGAVTDTTAHFEGTVDPHAPAEPLNEEGKAPYRTEWRIECLPACKNANGNDITGIVEAGESTAISPVAAGLESNAEYEATLIAHNALGSFESTKTFKTTLVPPVVKATQGGSDGKGGYTIAGVVNPKGSAITNCRFDWGPTAPDYAFSAECSPLPQGRDEVQIVHMGSGPGFTLSFGGQTTGEITNGATADELAAALRGLSSIGPSGITNVTRETLFTGYYYRVTFGGPLSATNLRLMTIHGIPGGEVYNEIEGGNSQFVSVEAHLSGLTPGVVYHYNLLATNAAGESETTDQEFVMTLADSENCPNTQLRKENSSLGLPECRAYEMVSAPGKEGFDALLRGFYGGQRVHYVSGAANIAKSGQGTLSSHYVSERTPSGWETIPNLNGPTGSFYDAPSNVRDFAVLSAYSPDLLSSAWSLNRTNKPDSQRYHQYLRKPDGSLEIIGAGTYGFGLYLQYSADLSHLDTWFNHEFGPGVYEWTGTGGAPPRRVDLDNTGAPIGTCTENYGGNASNRSVSADGSRVVNYVYGGCGAPNAPVGELWARVNGTTAFEVSASHCNRTAGDPGGLCNGPSEPKKTCEEHLNGYEIPEAFGCRNPKFIAATPDGSRVFFTTTRQLVNADTDQTNDIYACDIPSGNPAPSAGRGNSCSAFFRISGGATAAEVENVDTTSANGSMVMFTAKGVLANNEDAYGETAQPGDHNLYVWHQDAANPEGKISFVGKLETYADIYGNIKLQAQATPDGAYGVFTTDAPMVESDTDISKDVYRVDASTGELTRVSISVLGAGGNGPFDAVPPTTSAVSDDGQKIVFTTAEALSPLDGNAEPDAYLWTPKGVSLISTGAVKGGASSGNNQFAGGGLPVAIDGSGNDIYFPTYALLTPADVDVSIDVYDARVDGGFSFAKAQRCSGETCQPPSTAPPPTPASPANRPNGEGNVVPRTCPKGKVLKGSKCVKKPSKKHHKKTSKKKRHKKAGRNRGGSK